MEHKFCAALAAQVEVKPLDKTLTLAAVSRLAAKVVGDLPSGLGRGLEK